MRCDYFDRAECASCTLMGVDYDEQVAAKVRRVQASLDLPDEVWSAPHTGPETAFRNKAKFVVGGQPGALTFGILQRDEAGAIGYTDLRRCPIVDPALLRTTQRLAEFCDEHRLIPYDVAGRRGELKHLIATVSPDGEVMARLVLRSEQQLPRVRAGLPELLADAPELAVVSVNLHAEHKATLQGDTEIILTERTTLPMRLGEVTLHLRPQSFFQTNTEVARALYRQAKNWVAPLQARAAWDLYCGVGGFALHLLPQLRSVTGVEVSADAVASAELSAAELRAASSTPLGRSTFLARDATGYALAGTAPELVVVNPPRRGIGPDLADWLNHSTVRHVLYSSCNATTLAQDLRRLRYLTVRRAQVFDMFPQTEHHEVLVLLERTTTSSPGRRRRRH